MISIIVCSINPDLREKLKSNITKTIGCDFEFLYLDNRIEKKGICAVYNILADQAKGEYLCFVHEDVSFDSDNWGPNLVEQALDKSVGVLGFAGVGIMSQFPYWLDRYTNIHHFIQRTKDGTMLNDAALQKKDKDKELVVVLDGMFLFCRKNVWNECRFDENLFTGFHLYDMDFSFNVSQSYQNYVNQNIVMSHYSLGNVTKSYYDSMIDFYKKWKEKLPYSVYPDLFAERRNKFFHYALREFIRDIKRRTDIPNRYIIHYLKETDFLNSISAWTDAIRYIIKFSIKKRFSKKFTKELF